MTRYVATWNGFNIQYQIPDRFQSHPEEYIKLLEAIWKGKYYLGCLIPVKYVRTPFNTLGLVRVPYSN